jgi:hypothetical protein
VTSQLILKNVHSRFYLHCGYAKSPTKNPLQFGSETQYEASNRLRLPVPSYTRLILGA